MSVEAYFPEQILLRLPAGTLAKVRAAAKAEGKTSAEWMRQALRRALLESAADGARWTVEAHHDTGSTGPEAVATIHEHSRLNAKRHGGVLNRYKVLPWEQAFAASLEAAGRLTSLARHDIHRDRKPAQGPEPAR